MHPNTQNRCIIPPSAHLKSVKFSLLGSFFSPMLCTAVALFSGIIWANPSIPKSDCFLVTEQGHTIARYGDCSTAWAPCSTFKIPLALMGYDSHILQDANHPTFEFKHGYPDFLESWKLPQNPTTWIANSCVWYSQVLTKKLGIKKLAHYIKLFDYGNQDLSGDKGKNNGLTQAWLSSSLAISPQDQGVFLEKLCADHLPVSHDAIKKTKAILFVDNLDKGWKLYGKTGMGTQRDAEGNKTELQHGWFIGWIEKKHRKIVCVYHIVDAQKELDYAGRRAKKLATKHMRHIINDIESKEKAVPTP